MRIVTDAGVAFDLGVTETTPTVGITDYSRRVTDDFGVTTVVPRGFARKMSVRVALPFETVDAVQARMADLRATPVRFVADDRYRALSVRGFYKDFEIDLAVPPTSFCTLTVDGLAETDTLPDPGGDAAPEGSVSTLRLLQPIDVTDAVLIASTVAETDAPAWSADVTYADAARVILGHRVYESLVAGNRGADPVTSGKWVDTGPTGRWAMFDDAIGSVTSAAGAIVVTLAAGAIDCVALLDVTGATVRVQAAGYDRTLPVVGGAIVFDAMPGGDTTVTIAGAGGTAVGTLLVGRMVSLGITEASPTAGISDYSRKEVDDFGDVQIVERAWSKRMAAKALIRSDAVDAVFDRIAAVRARPSLWIGDAGLSALTIYGFFKDFSIEVGPTVSKLSLSIEGLSAGAPKAPRLTVPWSNITDPKGTRPADNATNSGDPESAFGPGKVKDVLGAVGEMPDLRTAIAVILDTPELADFVEGAHRLRDQTRQQLAAQLAGQLLAQARAKRTDELTHIEGLPVGPVVKRVDQERREGDEALAESITVVKADGERTAGDLDAEVLRLDRARIDAQQAEAVALSNVRAQLSSDVDGVERLTLGQVSRLDHAIADASGASATALQETEAQFGAEVDGVERLTRGEIARLDTAVANAEGAQATALQETRAQFGAAVDGVEHRALGEVTRLDRSLADAAGASAAAVANVRAQFDGEAGRSRAEVARLDSAVATGAQAAAQAIEQTRAELGDDIAAEVLRLDSVIAEAERVSAQALQSVRAELIGEVDGVSVLFAAETIRLDTTIAEKDRAVARALQDVRAELGGDQIGEVARLSAAITRLDEAIVDANGARAQSVEEVRAEVDGQVASVQFLMRAANGDEAVAQLLTTVGGVITGFKINGATYDFAIHAKRTTFIDPVSGKVYFYADADGKVRMDDVEVNRIAADAIDSPSLKRAAVSKTSFLSLDADRACERNVATTVVSYTFVKEDADSILKIQMFAQCYHADDLDFWGDIVVDGVARQRAQVRMPFDNANSRGQAPITPTVFLPGIGAGEHSVAFVLTSNETEGPTYVRAGSTLEVTELRRGAIGNASGSAAPVDPPPEDETGGGGGGSGDPDWDYGGGGGGWYEPTVPQQ